MITIAKITFVSKTFVYLSIKNIKIDESVFKLLNNKQLRLATLFGLCPHEVRLRFGIIKQACFCAHLALTFDL